jgi:alpha-D-ribose 1-methylphosphonate 5-phosphate C-P lyase
MRMTEEMQTAMMMRLRLSKALALITEPLSRGPASISMPSGWGSPFTDNAVT